MWSPRRNPGGRGNALARAASSSSGFDTAECCWICGLFDGIICSADVGLAKPEPKIYALAAERLGLSPAECVFVDDLERNIEAAHETGMHAIRFRVDLGVVLEEQFAAFGVRSTDASSAGMGAG